MRRQKKPQDLWGRVLIQSHQRRRPPRVQPLAHRRRSGGDSPSAGPLQRTYLQNLLRTSQWLVSLSGSFRRLVIEASILVTPNWIGEYRLRQKQHIPPSRFLLHQAVQRRGVLPVRVILLLLLPGKRQGQGQPPPLPLPVPKGAASRAPSSTPVGELRTGRIGGAVTTFEEFRETLTAWVGQVAPEQEGIVAEALRRAAFDQGQFRGESAAKASSAPSGAAASAPAVLPSASDAEPIVVEDRGDDIGLVNSDGEPETPTIRSRLRASRFRSPTVW